MVGARTRPGGRDGAKKPLVALALSAIGVLVYFLALRPAPAVHEVRAAGGVKNEEGDLAPRDRLHATQEKGRPKMKGPQGVEEIIPVFDDVYDFLVNDIHGERVNLNMFRGKVSLIVNVASHCGYTKANYEEMKVLDERHRERGLNILAFPCNQFGGQEADPPQTIERFVRETKGGRFPLMEKLNVNNPNQHPLYKFMLSKSRDTAPVKWNFEKFVVDKEGNVVARYPSGANPLSIEPLLLKLLG